MPSRTCSPRSLEHNFSFTSSRPLSINSGSGFADEQLDLRTEWLQSWQGTRMFLAGWRVGG